MSVSEHNLHKIFTSFFYAANDQNILVQINTSNTHFSSFTVKNPLHMTQKRTKISYKNLYTKSQRKYYTYILS